eukprot:361616-Chlamydomonas_euryale.AAC.20
MRQAIPVLETSRLEPQDFLPLKHAVAALGSSLAACLVLPQYSEVALHCMMGLVCSLAAHLLQQQDSCHLLEHVG